MEKRGLRFAGDFGYLQDVVAGSGEDERRAVKYAARRHDWLAAK